MAASAVEETMQIVGTSQFSRSGCQSFALAIGKMAERLFRYTMCVDLGRKVNVLDN